jgi:hypothetical protein
VRSSRRTPAESGSETPVAAVVAQPHRPVVGPVGLQPHLVLRLHRVDDALSGEARQVHRLERLDVLDAVTDAGGGPDGGIGVQRLAHGAVTVAWVTH